MGAVVNGQLPVVSCQLLVVRGRLSERDTFH